MHTHARDHTHDHTRTHMATRDRIRMRLHSRTHMATHAHTHTHMATRARMRMATCTRACTRASSREGSRLSGSCVALVTQTPRAAGPAALALCGPLRAAPGGRGLGPITATGPCAPAARSDKPRGAPRCEPALRVADLGPGHEWAPAGLGLQPRCWPLGHGGPQAGTWGPVRPAPGPEPALCRGVGGGRAPLLQTRCPPPPAGPAWRTPPPAPAAAVSGTSEGLKPSQPWAAAHSHAGRRSQPLAPGPQQPRASPSSLPLPNWTGRGRGPSR